VLLHRSVFRNDTPRYAANALQRFRSLPVRVLSLWRVDSAEAINRTTDKSGKIGSRISNQDRRKSNCIDGNSDYAKAGNRSNAEGISIRDVYCARGNGALYAPQWGVRAILCSGLTVRHIGQSSMLTRFTKGRTVIRGTCYRFHKLNGG